MPPSDSTSWLGIVVLVAIAVAVLYPVWRILTRMGFEAERRILFLIGVVLLPGLGVILLLWIIAVTPWPASKDGQPQHA